MQKSKGLLKKSCAWFLTFATVLTTVSSTGITSVFAEESTDNVETEAQVAQDTASQDTNQTPSVTQGSIYVKLNEGGTVVVSSDSGTKTVEKSDGKVTVKDSNNVSVDVTDSLVNDYYLVATEEVGSTVTINTTANEGYSIETYRILTDSGEVAESTDDFATLSSSYTHNTTVTETSKYIEIGFKADEVEDTGVEETQSIVEGLSSDDEDWRQQAEADPNWLCAGGELLTPEEMQEAYLELGLLTSVTSYYSKLYRSVSAGTAGTVTYYRKIAAEGSTVGAFEVNNQIAFCCDHLKTTPPKGTSASSLGEEGNENLRKVLYYGYNGPGSIVGTSTSDQVYTTLCASGALGTSSMGKKTTNYYNNLISQPAPPSSFSVTLWSTGNSYQRLATWDYNPKGTLNIKKVPEAGCAAIVSGNNMYSLKGAVFNVYSDSALTNLVAQVTSDFNGNTPSLELDAGNYYITEVVAPKGYEKATRYRTATVTSGGTNNFKFEDKIQGDPAAIRLQKQPNSSMTSAAGNTYLEGAEYTVKYYDNDSWSGTPKKTWVYRTDTLGRISFNDESFLISGTFYYNGDGNPVFLNGTYSVQETKAPTGYNLDNNIYQATVHGADSWTWTEQSSLLLKAYNSANGDTAVNEQVWKGSVKVHKEDIETGDALQGNSSHEGITFTIVNKSANSVSYDGNIIPVDGVVTTITTDANGDASTPEKSLEYGTYEIYESSTNSSMTLSDTNHYTFSITSDGQVVTLSTSFKDEVVRGDVRVTKQDKELHSPFINKISALIKGKSSQGDASLEGVTFEIYNRSNNSVIVDGKSYAVGAKIKTITTKYEGDYAVAQTTGGTFPYGKYGIKEVSTDGSYLLTDGKEYTFYITTDGQTVTSDSNGKELVWENEVKRGGVSVQKWDNDLKEAYAQGDATLEGATFAIKNISTSPVVVDGVLYSGKDATDGSNVVKTIKTNRVGYATTDTKCLPVGTYEIYEVDPSTGYMLNSSWKGTFKITKNKDDGQMVNFNVPTSTDAKALCYESVIRGGVQVTKYDKELNLSEALGNATLSGIDFEITNASAHNVYVEGKVYKPGEVVKTITSHWNATLNAYTAETSDDCLPYGTYTIKEVKTNNSYLLTDGNKRTFTIRENGKIVTKDTSDVDLIWRNQVVRGDAEFVKIADSTSRRISAPFIITNKETGEQHVIVTDANGQYNTNSSWNKHSEQTNVNDWIIETLKSDPTHCFTPEGLVSSAGVWFGEGEFGSMADVNDSLGALPYGDYILSEVRCDANATYELQNFEFTVYRDSVTVDLGTVTDDVELEPTISTVALDSESGRHVAMADEDVTIVDTVRVTGLVIGEEYTIKGKVMDYEDENIPISVTIDGKVRNLKSEVTFTANNVSMDIEVPFNFDATALANKTGVCYEGLYRGGKLLVKEADIDNADQAFHFPTISTEARDYYTEDSVGNNFDGKLVDTVSYTNLVPDEDYTMKGILYNKADSSIVAESSTDFIPDTANGSVEVTFNFDFDTQGMDLVATEELIANGAVVAEHKDMEDENQTVHYPMVNTSAIDVNSESQVGTVSSNSVIKDTVDYGNLVVGNEYTIKGKLVNKSTGEEIKGVTAETTFTASEKSGSEDVTFTFDSSELAGETVVVFEDLYYKGVKIATHSNVNDYSQSIMYPEITTSATDKTTKDKICTLGKTQIVDVVHCTNLVVGEEYNLTGVLMDKDTGKFLYKDVNGVKSSIKASTSFKAKATTQDVIVIIPVDTSEFEGKTIVVYEDLIKNGVIVRSHADLDDEDQTVKVVGVTTEAKSQTDLKEINAEGTQTIKDTVYLSNLTVGEKYSVKGNLRLKSTGDPIVIDGSLVTAETVVTASAENMYVDLSFDIVDATALKGETIVVYEDIYHNDTIVATHSDINDSDQTIRVPKVETSAYDDETLVDESLVSSKVNITDTVKYYNLEEGAVYTVKGTIMDKETGLPVVQDGKYVIGSTTFKAGTSEIVDTSLEYVDDLDEAFKSKDLSGTTLDVQQSDVSVNGSVNVSYSIDASDYSGKTIVMYENLYRDGVLVASHNDIEDENQDIKFIKIGTEALDKVTGSHELNAVEDATIVDTVSYSNATVGTTYKLVATLKDKNTGESIIINDKEVVVEKVFTAESTKGSVEVEIPFDATQTQGKSLVVFENMYNADKLVALHNDLSDENQTVNVIKVSTKAIDKNTGFNEGLADKVATIVDTVTYSNLTQGNSYTIKGILMDKETNEPIKVNGEYVVAEKEFIAGELSSDVSEDNRVSGSTELEFNMDSTELAGKTVVVFEEIYSSKGLVAHHTDIEDEKQTVTIPKISTTATDVTSGTHEQQSTEEAKIVDRVDYTNLTVGKEYEVTGILMDKETEKPILVNDKEITSTVVFTPTESNGYVDVEFSLNTSELAGKDIVAFETLTRDGKDVAIHADIEDENQTVSVIDITTTATDVTSGTHEMTLGDNVVLSDKVDYINLKVNSKYTVKGSVIDKESGNVIANAETEFTPVNSTDATNVEFSINTNALQGKTLVVYEELYDSEGVLVAVHKDINDANQTVTVPVAPVIPQTMDNYGWMYAIGTILFLVGIAVAGVVYRRKRKF